VGDATSRCGIVDAATRLRAGNPKNLVRFPAQARNISFFQSVHFGSGVYAVFYSISSEDVFTDGKCPWREAELLTNVAFKN